jgi:uncharacterized protein (TIGR00251 family)
VTPRPFRTTRDGLLIDIRLTPRAAKDAFDGMKEGRLLARVRAVPEDSRANAALVELVADEIGVAKSTVSLAAGKTSRLKTLLIAGDPKTLEARVAAWLKRFE